VEDIVAKDVFAVTVAVSTTPLTMILDVVVSYYSTSFDMVSLVSGR
jgi:hypothetical protein